MSKSIGVIGSGFSSLAAACYLAKDGYEVIVYEKNDSVGGRARKFSADGFLFDMGPSWYWMPEVFDNFFQDFGKKTSDYYDLVRLDPSYKMFFSQEDIANIPANLEVLKSLFESYESGAGKKLEAFLKDAAYKYDSGMNNLVNKPALTPFEFINLKVLKGLAKANLLRSFRKHARKYFSHPYLLQLVEFPILFLGAKPDEIPALYSLMNHADMSLGTWYPMGGMYKVVEGMECLAKELGVKITLNTPIREVIVKDSKAIGVNTPMGTSLHNIILSGADYWHTETALLSDNHSSYSKKYWDNRVLSPSCLLYYVGVNRKVKGLTHHNLFFDTNFEQHAAEIYSSPQWPKSPLFYVCAPSKTDPAVAPEGKENLFLLIPVASGLKDTEETREKYFQLLLERIKQNTGEDISKDIIYSRSYSIKDFSEDYNALKGNAYGLANTLRQTAFLKPKMKSKKVKGLYYTGQLTVPGPGVPPSLISGRIVSELIHKNLNE